MVSLIATNEGMLRHYVLERVAPKDFSEKEVDRLRSFWSNDECNMFERLLQSWIKQHLSYLRWYAEAYFICQLYDRLRTHPRV